MLKLKFNLILKYLCIIGRDLADVSPSFIPENCIVKMTSPPTYTPTKVKVPKKVNVKKIFRVHFKVKTCGPAHVLIGKGKKALEIVLERKADNKYEGIIRNKQGGKVLARKVYNKAFLNCKKFRRFYVSWTKGQIRVGQRNTKPLLVYKVENANRFKVKYIKVSGSKDAPAQWKISEYILLYSFHVYTDFYNVVIFEKSGSAATRNFTFYET